LLKAAEFLRLRQRRRRARGLLNRTRREDPR
jgi:hypothetical protein